jgi:DNA-directed RNA polymerase specialized sigma24 family protein
MPDVEIPASPDSAGRPTAVTDRLAAVAALRRLADQLEDAVVEQAMRAGWSWPEVAEALGVTRQAVHKKHARRLIAAGVKLRRRR